VRPPRIRDKTGWTWTSSRNRPQYISQCFERKRLFIECTHERANGGPIQLARASAPPLNAPT